MIPDQVIDRTTKRAGTFYEHAAVHVEFAEPFCPVLRRLLMEEAPTAHKRGCYVAMEGPAFSTRAESLMHRIWGGDLIGMTAMPEAKLAREAEIPYALIALVTDYDCWKRPKEGGGEELLAEILANLKAGTEAAVGLMKRTVERMGRERALLETCPAMTALKLAIWSDKAKIPADEITRLAPLWGNYFG